jgi:hypothetical protein
MSECKCVRLSSRVETLVPAGNATRTSNVSAVGVLKTASSSAALVEIGSIFSVTRAGSNGVSGGMLVLADALGAFSAATCAVHCALLPVIMALLPALGIGALASSGFEYRYVAFASALALSSIWQGYRRHRNLRALAVLVLGLSAVWGGLMVPILHEQPIAHSVVMGLGGALIAAAHLINLRRSHAHRVGSACSAPWAQ